MTSEFLKVSSEDFGEEHLLCPMCGYHYTHLEKVEEYREKDNRLCVKLYFFGECGHTFVLDFHQHEGVTFLNRRFS